MKIKISDIRLFARFGSFERGKQLFQSGQVQLKSTEVTAFEALVEAEGGPYWVRVVDQEPRLNATCSCKTNYYHHCDHIVAALFAGRDYYQHHQEEPIYRETHPSWQSFLQNLHKENGLSRSPQRRGPRQWQIIYQLYLRPNSWTIVPHKAYIKKDGLLGRLLPLNSNENDLSETQLAPNDPIAIAYLLQKNRWDYNTHFVDYYGYRSTYWDSFPYATPSGRLFELLRESSIYIGSDGTLDKPIRFAKRPGRLEFRFLVEQGQRRFVPCLYTAEGETILEPPFYVLTQNPVWLLRGSELLKIENLDRAELLLPFSRENLLITVPENELIPFIDGVLQLGCVGNALNLPGEFTVRETGAFDKKRLYLKEKNEHLEFQLAFLYQEIEVEYSQDPAPLCRVLPNSRTILKIYRDQAHEQEAWQALLDSGLKYKPQKGLQLDEKKVIPWLFHSLPHLTEAGFEIFGHEKLKKYRIRTGAPTVRLAVSTDIDWFDLNLEIDFDGVSLTMKELKKALSHDERYVKLADNSVALLPEEWAKKFQFLFHFARVEDQHLKLSQWHVSLIDQLFEELQHKRTDRGYRQRLARLKEFAGLREVALPARFKGRLRPYQKAGYDWLHFLKEFDLGGCLADDMGLGKTVQALALLQKEKERGSTHPSLIVCPTSVVFNWEKEVLKFTPHLRVLTHTGLQRRRHIESFADYDIVLTSYGLVLRDIVFLKDYTFHYIILDESQKIKNPLSQTAKAVRLLKAEHRLVLTGTPVENNTTELWSQFSFLNPGLLGSLPSFRSFFSLPIEKRQDVDMLRMLKRLTFPFILRRSKELVEKELPPKSEQIYYCTMNPEQEKMYRQWRDYYRSVILQKIDQSGLDKARMNILEGLVKLRQVACHPLLVDKKADAESAKFEALKEMLEEILAEQHKVLIFSQFVKMLTVVRTYLDEQGIAYEYLDGHTVHREQCVERFQTDASVRVFLISLKAGGTGLNLTAADYVILYDPWWNPAVEMQATDRAHRIGQERKVFVYRMIAKDTVEEKMLELQERKRGLVSNLITIDGGVFKSLTRDDIEALFS